MAQIGLTAAYSIWGHVMV